jgi:hypothetical protein
MAAFFVLVPIWMLDWERIPTIRFEVTVSSKAKTGFVFARGIVMEAMSKLFPATTYWLQ